MGLNPGRVKPKTIKLIFATSLLSMQQYFYKEKEEKTGSFRIRIMC